MIKRVGYLLVAVASSLALWPAGLARAASASLYLSPSSGSVSKGSTISVSVRENSGSTKVNSVQANLAYPASSLAVSSIESSSAYNFSFPGSYGNGSIQIARAALPAVSGDQLVATIIFKALADSGTANVSFTSGSKVDSASTNKSILSSKSGGNYTLTRAPSGSGSGSGGGSSAKKDTTAPKISNISTSPSATKATISWTTSEPSTSEVDYGLNNGYGITAINNKLVTAHKVVLASPIIEPATLYHFRVKSADAAGNIASSQDSTFRTQGGVLNVTVVNQNNKPVGGAVLNFADQTATTDKNGHATLSNLPVGNLTGTLTYKGAKLAESANIKTADPTKPQSIQFQIITKGRSVWFYGLPLVLLLAVLWYWWRRRRSNHLPPPQAPAPSQSDWPATPPSHEPSTPASPIQTDQQTAQPTSPEPMPAEQTMNPPQPTPSPPVPVAQTPPPTSPPQTFSDEVPGGEPPPTPPTNAGLA